MTLHELITLMIILIGTSGTNEIQYIKYRSEYILKLQIHQHVLLTEILITVDMLPFAHLTVDFSYVLTHSTGNQIYLYLATFPLRIHLQSLIFFVVYLHHSILI